MQAYVKILLERSFSFLSGEAGCPAAVCKDLYEAGSHCSPWKGPQQGRQPHCSPWKTSHWDSLFSEGLNLMSGTVCCSRDILWRVRRGIYEVLWTDHEPLIMFLCIAWEWRAKGTQNDRMKLSLRGRQVGKRCFSFVLCFSPSYSVKISNKWN